MSVSGEILFGLKRLCGRPSPMKRFVSVVIAGCVMAIVFVCILVSSVYKIGYTNAQKDIPELNIVRQLILKNDSINLLKQQLNEYEYEQSGK
jgi:hypothetical protein